MKKLTVAFILSVSALNFTTQANAETNEEVNTLTFDGILVSKSDPALEEFYWQRSHGAPPVSFWRTIAHCETRQDWQNPGRFAGGLGIMTAKRFPEGGMGTWERWGGEQFAPRPDKATPLQQIVVANRIAMFGWEAKFRRWDGHQMRVREKHYVKHKTGFNGWGCISMRRDTHRDHNPRRFEARTPRPMLTYQVFPLTVPLNVPRYAWNKVPHKWLK